MDDDRKKFPRKGGSKPAGAGGRAAFAVELAQLEQELFARANATTPGGEPLFAVAADDARTAQAALAAVEERRDTRVPTDLPGVALARPSRRLLRCTPAQRPDRPGGIGDALEADDAVVQPADQLPLVDCHPGMRSGLGWSHDQNRHKDN